ncbi:MAG: DUF1080 domain-containing protein [Actinobacteria bacterium]|nr:DUF1080 domain-containing protein [Actinomycetota bacterium]
MLNKKLSIFALLFVVTSFFILAACNGQQKQSNVQLPSKAAQAIAKTIPGAKIVKVKKEKEDGKQFFEVQVQAGDKTYELDVSADGRILNKEENSGEESEEENEEETVFNFDSDVVGSLPQGWSNRKTGKGGLGSWSVMADPTAPSKPNVLAQTSKKNPGYHFNVAVAEQTHFSDVEIELKFKAIDGQEDQGGGPVWRYKDADNYYVCRANPLESNFRVYKVVDGNRKQLQSAKVDIPANVWHSLKVKNVGNHIQCWYDGKLYLDTTDDTFTSGKVGLWTKADAVTWFDNVKIEKEE